MVETDDARRRTLGNSGISVSIAALGGNVFGPPRLDQDQTIEIVSAALDLGVDFVDTADIYGGGYSEEFLGVALRGRRDRMTIATKFNLRDLGDEPLDSYIRHRAEQSLRKLGTDRIDLYQLHLPRDDVPFEEVLQALAGLIADGKVGAIGVCNFAGWRLAEATATARELGVPGISTVQNYYHVLARELEAEVGPYCHRTGLGVLPYHPLAGGFLTGKYRDGQSPPAGTRGAAGSPMVTSMLSAQSFTLLDRLSRLAADAGHTIGELALAWLAAQPDVSAVIAGVSSVAQLQANVAGCSWALEPDLLAAVDTVTRPGWQSSPETPPYLARPPVT
jgi:aryl-alcohol dehydrogenase-like predicted oxidoreductase